jgi:hypothetical protein
MAKRGGAPRILQGPAADPLTDAQYQFFTWKAAHAPQGVPYRPEM